MYRNATSQQCVTETNTVSWVNYTSKTNKLTHRKRSELWLPEGGVEEGELGEGSQIYPQHLSMSKFVPPSYKINKY